MRGPTPEERDAFTDALSALTDDELVSVSERQVWFSAFAANNPRAPAHWKVDLASDEATKRGKPWLYQRGWNAAYRSCGYEPSEESIEAAKEGAGSAEGVATVVEGEGSRDEPNA